MIKKERKEIGDNMIFLLIFFLFFFMNGDKVKGLLSKKR